MYAYHDTEIRAERIVAGRDHCDSAGRVYRLVDLLHSGRLTDPDNDASLLTTSFVRRMIYAVDGDLNVHVAFDGERGQRDAVKHETLFHNAPVLAAGEIRIDDGIVHDLDDKSGSYGTIGQMMVDRRFAQAVLNALERAHVAMTEPLRKRLAERGGL